MAEPLPVSEQLTAESAHAHEWVYPDERGGRTAPQRRVCRLCALYQEKNPERGTWAGYGHEPPEQMMAWGYWARA